MLSNDRPVMPAITPYHDEATAPRSRAAPTGPRTVAGKDRSSTNRTRHGLTGRALVLPGERVADYRSHQARWSSTLPAGSHGEAVIVFEIGDIDWRRQRLLRLEHAHLLGLVEDIVRSTEDYELHSLAIRALTAVNALNGHALAAISLDPFPATATQLGPFLAGARGTKSLVGDVEGLDARVVRALEIAVSDLEEAASTGAARADHIRVLANAAQAVQELLAGTVEQGKAKLDRLRDKAAAVMVPRDDRESRRLARYRAELEKSQARLLAILGQVRDQRKLAHTDVRESGMQPINLRLRVVK